MTLEQYREQEIEKHEKNLVSIDAAKEAIPEPLVGMVEFVNSDSVFLRRIRSIEDVFEALRGCKYELSSYFMSHDDCLAVSYAIAGVDFVFYITEYKAALEVLSGGKCKIVKNTKEKVELSVSCQTEEN